MKGDAHRELAPAHRRQRVDREVHTRRRIGGAVRRREQRHDLVAHRLHHSPAARFGRAAQGGEATLDSLDRLAVARRLVKTGAARDIGEQHGGLALAFHGGGFSGDIYARQCCSHRRPHCRVSTTAAENCSLADLR
jgi:hypothetical protein